MITKEYGVYKIVCDICETTSCADYETFDEAVEGKKDNGYQSKKYSDGWKDICSDCRD